MGAPPAGTTIRTGISPLGPGTVRSVTEPTGVGSPSTRMAAKACRAATGPMSASEGTDGSSSRASSGAKAGSTGMRARYRNRTRRT